MSLALAAGVVLPAAQAAAHPDLHSAVASPASTVTQTPSEATIAFSGAPEPRFNTIRLADERSQRTDDLQLHPFAVDARRPPVGLRDVSLGASLVMWHATAVGTHRTDGSYPFTLAAADASTITLDHPWARPTAGAATTGVVYFTVTDKGSADHLVKVSTPIAATAELHETINDNGIMKMRSVPSIALEPGKPVMFKPGGYHVMLMGLKSPLKVGDSFPLTLTFEHTQPITVSAKVEAAGGTSTDHAAMPGMQGH
jgi:hypothetical protein